MGKQVYIIGAGPGRGDLLTGEAREALERCGRVIGAGRLLDALSDILRNRERVPAVTTDAVLAAIRDAGPRVCAVLVSGDSGSFSLSRRLFPLVRAEGWDVRLLCGISSVSYLASRLGIPYDDALVRSFHGRLVASGGGTERERLLNRLAGYVAQNKRCFFLTDNVLSPELLCRALSERGFGKIRVSVGERLSHPDERISAGTADDIAGMNFGDPNMICVENDGAAENTRISLRDADFSRGAVPMTKEEVRTVSLAKLRLGPDSVCWDLGAGTGSVACAAALAVPYGRVYAVEREPDALELVRLNARRLGLYNLVPVEGEAPAALAGLPSPDSVFVGGSGGALRAIVREALARNPRARIVINALTLETLSHAREAAWEHSFSGAGSAAAAEIVQIGVSAVQKAGAYSMLRAQNPVFVISFGGAA
jgi:precorrin-6Y C5,15-methyltransferase (decarboxylating)